MIQKIKKSSILGNGPIKVMYPGLSISKEDTGIASIGRIDHAYLEGKTTIAMHPHSNDEILSYFRSGKAEHTDSEKISETIGAKKLMLMKAGKIYHHEEEISAIGNQPFEGLQIFIRPAKKDTLPEVVFYDLEEEFSINQWRLLASPSNETPLQFSSQSWVWDAKLIKGNSISLPEIDIKGKTLLLYVYQGDAVVNGIDLEKKESVIVQDEKLYIETSYEAELVLFVTDNHQEIYKNGMYSGNQIQLT